MRKYTFLQKLRASMMNVNVEWLYATEVERMIMRFKSLSEEEQKEFLNKINNN
jgi:hypothetical protein